MSVIEQGSMNKKTARTAGLLYLIVVVTGIINLAYVPSRIVVRGDVSATVDNITTFEPLFRFGIVAGLICYTAFLLLPLALYKLLHPVGKVAAILMVAFAVVSVPVSFGNELNKLEILSLLSRDDYLRAFTTEQLQARVRLLLDAYSNGLLVLQIFWGLWLLPFGYLVFKSGVLPRVLGILLMMGGCGYVLDFFGSALFRGYAETSISNYVTKPASFGEIGICLWLLIVGVRQPKSPVVSVRGAA